MATEDILTVKLDNEGDLVIKEDTYGNKDFATVRGQDAIRQDIQVRILTLLGERVLHPDYGMDFPAVETVFDQNLVRGEMARTILLDPDVKEITEVEILFDGRVRKAQYQGTVRLLDDSLIGVIGIG